jgi:hypothetical protein
VYIECAYIGYGILLLSLVVLVSVAGSLGLMLLNELMGRFSRLVVDIDAGLG